MASTPSASALSAVLRCKRPPASAYRLGLSYGGAPQPVTDQPGNRSPVWGLTPPDARGLNPPGAGTVPARLLKLAKARGQNQTCRTNYVSEHCFSPKIRDTTSQQLQPRADRPLTRVNEKPPDSDHRPGRRTGVCPRTGHSPAVKISSFSVHGAVFTVCLDCEKNFKMSVEIRGVCSLTFSALKSRLLRVSALLSGAVLTGLRATWRTEPGSNHHLTRCEKCASECEKKNKPRKDLEPGT